MKNSTIFLSKLTLSLLILLMAGCVAPIPAESQTSPDAEIESTVVPTPFVETHVNADWTNVQSRSEDGLAMLGNPDAPVTFIDYSDFM